jgi:hypothetical protein
MHRFLALLTLGGAIMIATGCDKDKQSGGAESTKSGGYKGEGQVAPPPTPPPPGKS